MNAKELSVADYILSKIMNGYPTVDELLKLTSAYSTLINAANARIITNYNTETHE